MSLVYHFVASIPDIVNNNGPLEIRTTKKNSEIWWEGPCTVLTIYVSCYGG